MAKLDESALRKPDFTEDGAAWVTLADGQDWCIPLPYRVFEVSDDGLRMLPRRYVAGGDDYPDPFSRMDENVSEEDLMSGFLNAVKFLLLRNYNLQPGDFRQLIQLGGYIGNAPAAVTELTETLRDIVGGLYRPKSPGDDTSNAA